MLRAHFGRSSNLALPFDFPSIVTVQPASHSSAGGPPATESKPDSLRASAPRAQVSNRQVSNLPYAAKRRASARSFAQSLPQCWVVSLDPQHGLLRSLADHLSDELREVRFSTRQPFRVDVLWAVGYEPRHERELRVLRERHPEARLVVSSRDLTSEAAAHLRHLGVDAVVEWPAVLPRLRAALLGRRRRSLGA